MSFSRGSNDIIHSDDIMTSYFSDSAMTDFFYNCASRPLSDVMRWRRQ